MSASTQGTNIGGASVLDERLRAVASPRVRTFTPVGFSKIFELMLALEFVTVFVTAYLASIVYHFVSYHALPSASAYAAEAIFVAIIFAITSLGFRHGVMLQRQQPHLLLWSGVGAVALAFFTLLAVTFLLKISNFYSRGTFVLQLIGAIVAVCVVRGTLLIWLRSAVATGKVEVRRTILIGDATSCTKLSQDWQAIGITVPAVFELPREAREGNNPFCHERPTSGPGTSQLIADCRAILPDDIVILADHKDLPWATELSQCLATLPCDIHISPLGDLRFLSRSQTVEYSRGNSTLRTSRRPLTLFDCSLKRLFDIVIALAALVMLSPLLLLTALAIKIDAPGKVLFRQMRHGYNNQVFEVFKFRTMTASDNGQSAFEAATYRDSRVTNIGRILRQTNIDELPQLINVLFGDMSIVGPRPHALMHNQLFEHEIAPFARRHSVKPGITGWAQVNGFRGPAMTLDVMRQRIEHDIYYIENWSFFLDLKIVLMTAFSKSAYRNAF